ncbi:MAG: esterase-like activity of phytase family protein [Ahrensia sp.]|nr:esterase-like activity of phytase family protein [Ahrensia sp.]
MIRLLAAAIAVALIAALGSTFLTRTDGAWRNARSISIEATPISVEDFGPAIEADRSSFRFTGGLVLRSNDPDFGALSGLRVTDQGLLTGVTDTGFWLRAEINRDAGGRPVALQQARMAPLLNEAGETFSAKWFGDAESLTFKGAAAYVGTEQDTRVMRYAIGDDLLTAASTRFGPPLPGEQLSYNRGLEALATIPVDLSFAGALLAIAETPPRGETHHRAFIITANSVKEIAVAQRDGFAITDADFLPDGSLLLLERKFSPALGPHMRLRRIAWQGNPTGDPLDGTVVLDLNRDWQIDNMEGLSVFEAPDGSIRIGLVSDDNHWPLQRTLYLEFALEQISPRLNRLNAGNL